MRDAETGEPVIAFSPGYMVFEIVQVPRTFHDGYASSRYDSMYVLEFVQWFSREEDALDLVAKNLADSKKSGKWTVMEVYG